MSTFKIYLPNQSNWWYINQVTQIDPETGQPSAARFNLCGETCVSEIIFYKTGKKIAPDVIRRELYGDAYTGISYNTDLVSYLNATPPAGKTFTNTTKISASTLPPAQTTTPINAKGSLLYNCWNYLVTNNPLIVLRHYDYPGNSILHWVTVNGDSEDAGGTRLVYFSDSIDGREKTETYEQFTQMYAGLTIGTGTPRYGLEIHPPLRDYVPDSVHITQMHDTMKNLCPWERPAST